MYGILKFVMGSLKLVSILLTAGIILNPYYEMWESLIITWRRGCLLSPPPTPQRWGWEGDSGWGYGSLADRTAGGELLEYYDWLRIPLQQVYSELVQCPQTWLLFSGHVCWNPPHKFVRASRYNVIKCLWFDHDSECVPSVSNGIGWHLAEILPF